MHSPDRYHIGALARLAGVPVETLRTWERRYGVPSPATREEGIRVYDGGEVERVRIIAELNRLGDRVRDLAALDPKSLEDRLSAHRAARREAPLPSVLRVAAVLPTGHDGPAGVSPSGLTRADLVARAARAADLPELPDPVDVLVVALGDGDGADLLTELDDAVARVRPAAVVVRAAFLGARVRKGLVARNARLVTDPRPAELRRAVEDAAILARVEAGAQPTPPPAARRLAPEALQRLMSTPSTVQCECLNHLAGIVLTVDAFERYSRACETAGGPDADLHRGLAEGADQARALLEALLLRVARHEGIPL